MGAQGERRPKDFLPPDEAIDKLTQLRKQYVQRSSSGKDLKPVRYAPAPENRRFLPDNVHLAMLYHDHLVSKYLMLQRDFERWCVGLTDTLLAFLTATRRNTSFEARCSTSKFNAHVVSSHNKRPFKRLQEKVHRMRKSLSRIVPRFPTFEYTDPYLRFVLLRVVPLVNTKADWVPFNDFDSEFAMFVGCSGLAPELAELAYGLNGGDRSSVISYVKAFGKRLELKSSDIDCLIVVKHAVYRYLFDFLFLNNMALSASREETELFCEKCGVVASCSARSLGTPEHLLTPEQLDPALATLIRTTPSIAAISIELASLHFYTAPTDVLLVLQDIFQKIDELARQNALERTLGPFTQMVDRSRKPRKMSFMSFDDCFSLFFAILAIDPPRNALSVCQYFTRLPDLSTAAPAKYAIATFVTAIQHIMEFSVEQLVVSNRDSDDPLGIT
jgi:hypothetical protein